MLTKEQRERWKEVVEFFHVEMGQPNNPYEATTLAVADHLVLCESLLLEVRDSAAVVIQLFNFPHARVPIATWRDWLTRSIDLLGTEAS